MALYKHLYFHFSLLPKDSAKMLDKVIHLVFLKLLQFTNLTKSLNYNPEYYVRIFQYLSFLSASTVLQGRDWLKVSFRFIISHIGNRIIGR